MAPASTSTSDLHLCTDSESRATDEHHQALRLWLRMLACTNLIQSRLRQLLWAEFETTLPRFDLMAQLERAPEGLRMGELSRRMMVTGGNVTGITDMLEEEGLVVRVVPSDDRRAFRAKLTEKGRRQFKRMAVEHERWVVQMFDGLSVKRQTELGQILATLKTDVARQLQDAPS